MDELQCVPVALALGRCGCQRSTMPSSDGVDPVTADHVGEFRRQVMANGRVVARMDNHARHLFPVAIGPEEGEALLARVVDERAHRTLESGLGFGISTLFVCQGLLANGGWARQDGGREGIHEWAILRTGSRDVFLRPYTDFVGFYPV